MFLLKQLCLSLSHILLSPCLYIIITTNTNINDIALIQPIRLIKTYYVISSKFR